MISKMKFPAYNGVISEATVFTKEEVKAASEMVKASIAKDKEIAQKAAIAYKEQFLPRPIANFVTPEDAVQSYAISHKMTLETLQ